MIRNIASSPHPSSPHPIVNPAGQAGLLLIRLGLIILAFGTQTTAVFSRRLIFTLVPVGAVLIILGSLLKAEPAAWRRMMHDLSTPLVLIAVGLMGWSALSLLWTPMASAASEHWLKMAGTAGLAAMACICLPSHSKISNLNLLPISAAVSALIIFAIGLWQPIQAADPAGSTLQRAAMIVALLSWPAMAALAVRSRWALVGALAIAIAFAIIAVWSAPLLIASTFAACAFAVSLYRPSITGQILGWFFAACLVLAPALPILFLIVPIDTDAQSFAGHLAFWGQIIQLDGPRLITGHGFDAVMHGIAIGLPLDRAPASVVFEIWYELGVVGAMLGAVLIRAAFALADRFQHPGAEPFVVACLTHIIALMVLGVTPAQLWFLTVMALIIIMLGLLAHGQYQIIRPRLPQR